MAILSGYCLIAISYYIVSYSQREGVSSATVAKLPQERDLIWEALRASLVLSVARCSYV